LREYLRTHGFIDFKLDLKLLDWRAWQLLVCDSESRKMTTDSDNTKSLVQLLKGPCTWGNLRQPGRNCSSSYEESKTKEVLENGLYLKSQGVEL